jgi:hypothetical protein
MSEVGVKEALRFPSTYQTEGACFPKEGVDS